MTMDSQGRHELESAMTVLGRLELAHAHCAGHRKEIQTSQLCGCFYCLAVYPPTEITDWVDEGFNGEGQTALCARCGIDSVIGDRSGFPLTPSFLAEMNRHFF